MPLLVIDGSSTSAMLRTFALDGTEDTGAAIDLGSGSFRAVCRTPTRIYVSDTTDLEFVAYDHDGNRQSGDDIDAPGAVYLGLFATVDRIYGLDSGNNALRAWDHDGNRQAGDDVSIDSVSWQAAAGDADRFFAINSTVDEVWSYDYDGNRQTAYDLPLPAGGYSGLAISPTRFFVGDAVAGEVVVWDRDNNRLSGEDFAIGDVRGLSYFSDIPDPAPIAATLTAPSPTLAVALTTITPLVLADYDSTGRDVDAAALLEKSSATSPIWNAPARGGTDVPLDGEVGLGAGDDAITAIRLRANPQIRIQDSTALNIGAYFDAGGDGHDLRLTIQALAGAVAVDMATAFVSGTSTRVDIDIGGGGWNLLNNLAVGDRFILAFDRPLPAPLAATLTAPTPTVSAAVTVSSGTTAPLAATLTAPTPTVSAAVTVSSGTTAPVAATLTASTPSLAAALTAQPAPPPPPPPPPPPVTGGLRVTVGGVDASGYVLGSPPVVTERGSPRRAPPFLPQVDTAELALRSAAPVEDGVEIAVLQTAPARTLFAGTVADAENRDTLASNLARIRVVGPLAALAKPGPSVALMTAPLVSEAVEALLEACGIVAGERAVADSTRRLALFWLASDAQPIRVLQQLVATDGPGARLYVDGAGLVRFEPDGTRSTQGRSTAVQATYDAAARVTSVPAARNVSVQYQAETPQPLAVTVEFSVRFMSTAQATTKAVTGLRDRDLIIVAGGGNATVHLGTSASDPEFTRYQRPGASGNEPFLAYYCWRTGDATTVYPTTLLRHYQVYVARSSGGAVRPGDVAARLGQDALDLFVPSVGVDRGDLIITAAEARDVDAQWDAPPGFTLGSFAGPGTASLEAIGPLDTTTVAWRQNVYRPNDGPWGIIAQQFIAGSAFAVGAFQLAAGETRDIVVDVRGITTAAVTVEGEVSAGSATFTATVLSPQAVRVRAVAGASGATVEGVTVITRTRSFGRDAKTAAALATAERDFAVPAWPYITGPVAQDVADDWAANLNAPRQVVEWDVDCFGDVEFEACAEREMSDRVRVRGIGSTLNERGHIEAIQVRLSHATTGRYRFRMLT